MILVRLLLGHDRVAGAQADQQEKRLALAYFSGALLVEQTEELGVVPVDVRDSRAVLYLLLLVLEGAVVPTDENALEVHHVARQRSLLIWVSKISN